MDLIFKRLAQCRLCRWRTDRARIRIQRIRRDYSSTVLTANERLARNGITTIDLEHEYDKTLRSIVKDNVSILRPKYLHNNDLSGSSIVGDKVGEDALASADLALPGLKSYLNEQDHEIDLIIKCAARDLNKSYYRVKRERELIPRRVEAASIKSYNRFLRQLYGTVVGGRYELHSTRLFEAYQALPYPAPLYISPAHLEDLISLLMSTKWGTNDGRSAYYKNSQASSIFLNVLADLGASDMPISVREYNAAMNMTAKIDGGHELNLPLIEERFNQIKLTNDTLTDVSTLNMLMIIASRSGENNERLLGKVMEEFRAHNLKPDRFTLMIYMKDRSIHKDVEGVKAIYQDLQMAGFIIDMQLLNVAMQSLLSSGDTESAEGIYRVLLQHGLKLSSKHSTFSQSRLMRKLQLMDHFQTIIRTEESDEPGKNQHQQQRQYYLPTIPDYTTFSIFFNHYCMFGRFDQAIEVLHTMQSRQCPPTRHQFYRLIKAFETHANTKHQEEWTLGRLKFVLSMILEQDPSECLTFLMAENAIRTYALLDKDSNIGGLAEDLKSRRQPRHHVVYNALKHLIDL